MTSTKRKVNKEYQTERLMRLAEAVADLRTEVFATRDYAFNSARKHTVDSYVEAIKFNEYASGIEWTLDSLEYYLEHGRMP